MMITKLIMKIKLFFSNFRNNFIVSMPLRSSVRSIFQDGTLLSLCFVFSALYLPHVFILIQDFRIEFVLVYMINNFI
jgi:hypothetical protein